MQSSLPRAWSWGHTWTGPRRRRLVSWHQCPGDRDGHTPPRDRPWASRPPHPEPEDNTQTREAGPLTTQRPAGLDVTSEGERARPPATKGTQQQCSRHGEPTPHTQAREGQAPGPEQNDSPPEGEAPPDGKPQHQPWDQGSALQRRETQGGDTPRGHLLSLSLTDITEQAKPPQLKGTRQVGGPAPPAFHAWGLVPSPNNSR